MVPIINMNENPNDNSNLLNYVHLINFMVNRVLYISYLYTITTNKNLTT